MISNLLGAIQKTLKHTFPLRPTKDCYATITPASLFLRCRTQFPSSPPLPPFPLILALLSITQVSGTPLLPSFITINTSSLLLALLFESPCFLPLLVALLFLLIKHANPIIQKDLHHQLCSFTYHYNVARARGLTFV